jgi:cytidyltransferase-like protein
VSDFRHALVIGKFYPPHAGHECLIRAAAQHAERATVVVMAESRETLSLEERVAWLREVAAPLPQVTVVGVRDDVPVDYAREEIWAAHVERMREGVSLAGPRGPSMRCSAPRTTGPSWRDASEPHASASIASARCIPSPAARCAPISPRTGTRWPRQCAAVCAIAS